jgi:hypothetical protein
VSESRRWAGSDVVDRVELRSAVNRWDGSVTRTRVGRRRHGEPRREMSDGGLVALESLLRGSIQGKNTALAASRAQGAVPTDVSLVHSH